MLDSGGEVTGIIPEFLANREHMMLRGNIVRTRDMHERKQLMFDHADAFVALPGGVGTLEELVEQMTWVQLGRHRKPVLLANIKAFWEPLRALLAHMEEFDFIRPGLAGRLSRRRPDRRRAADADGGRGADRGKPEDHGTGGRRAAVSVHRSAA